MTWVTSAKMVRNPLTSIKLLTQNHKPVHQDSSVAVLRISKLARNNSLDDHFQ